MPALPRNAADSFRFRPVSSSDPRRAGCSAGDWAWRGRAGARIARLRSSSSDLPAALALRLSPVDGHRGERGIGQGDDHRPICTSAAKPRKSGRSVWSRARPATESAERPHRGLEEQHPEKGETVLSGTRRCRVAPGREEHAQRAGERRIQRFREPPGERVPVLSSPRFSHRSAGRGVRSSPQ